MELYSLLRETDINQIISKVNITVYKGENSQRFENLHWGNLNFSRKWRRAS